MLSFIVQRALVLHPREGDGETERNRRTCGSGGRVTGGLPAYLCSSSYSLTAERRTAGMSERSLKEERESEREGGEQAVRMNQWPLFAAQNPGI